MYTSNDEKYVDDHLDAPKQYFISRRIGQQALRLLIILSCC